MARSTSDNGGAPSGPGLASDGSETKGKGKTDTKPRRSRGASSSKVSAVKMRKYLLAQYDKFLGDRIGDYESGILNSATSGSLSFTGKLRARGSDDDFDVIVSGKSNINWNGDTAKARVENEQLDLL